MPPLYSEFILVSLNLIGCNVPRHYSIQLRQFLGKHATSRLDTLGRCNRWGDTKFHTFCWKPWLDNWEIKKEKNCNFSCYFKEYLSIYLSRNVAAVSALLHVFFSEFCSCPGLVDVRSFMYIWQYLERFQKRLSECILREI